MSLHSSSLTCVFNHKGDALSENFPALYNTKRLMVYREIIAVYSEVHSKHTTAMCRQKVEFFLMFNVVVRLVTTGL